MRRKKKTAGRPRNAGADQADAEDRALELLVVSAFDQIAGAVPSGQLSRTKKFEVARKLLVDLDLRDPDPEAEPAPPAESGAEAGAGGESAGETA